MSTPTSTHRRLGGPRAATWLAAFAILGIVVVMLAAVLGARRFSESRIEDDVRTTLARTSELSSIAAAENIDRLATTVTDAALDADVVEAMRSTRDPERLDAIARRMEQVEGVRVAFVVAPDSTVLGMHPVDEAVRGARFQERDWYRGVQERSPYLSEAYEIAAFDNPRAVTIAAKVRDAGRELGILTVVVETARLGRAIDRVSEVDGTPLLAIVDQSGSVVAGQLDPGDDARTMQDRRMIPGTAWHVVATVDRSEAFADVVSVRRAATWLMGAVLALLLVLSLVLVRTSRRLAVSRRATERQNQAFELNDTIVQRLAIAQLALSVDRADEAVEQLDAALASARQIIGDLAEGRPDYVRVVAAGDDDRGQDVA